MPLLPRSRVVACAGLYAASAGGVSLLGWALDVPRLADWDLDGLAIQPNTTVAAMAAGVALLLLDRGRRRAAAGFGAVAAVIGATALFENLSGVRLGIDTLLMFDRTWGGRATRAPGLMGPPASVSWTLIGTALALHLGGRRARRAVAVLGITVAAIGALSLTGYLFGADALYTLPWLTAIAWQTSTILLAVGLALTASVPEQQPVRGVTEDSAAGLLTRRALPFIVILPLAVGWLRIAGQNAGLYDTPMGTAMLVLTLIGMLCGVLWWSAAAVRTHERKLARAAELNARADLVLRAVHDQFLVVDESWRYVFVNDAVCEVSGLARERLLGQRIWDLFPDIVGTELEAAARRVRERKQLETVEYYHAPWQRWFDNRIYPTPDGGVAFLIVERTERKRADAALRESEERFRTLVSIITDVPWTTDAAGEFVAPQREWEAYTGQSWEEMRGSGWNDALHPEDRAGAQKLWQHACQTGSMYESTGRLWHARSGGYRHCVARAAPLRDEGGTLRAWVGTYTDVHDAKTRELALSALATEREELLAAAERARAEAETANRAKDEFLAVLSHELRSPLNAMLGWVQILRSAGASEAMVARAVDTLERNIWAQAQVINDLLDVSRITTGKLELERARVDLAAVVAGAVESMRPAAAGKRLALELSIRGDGLDVEGDAARLQQVAANILHNAVKFTPEGGRVSVALREADGHAVLEVEDTGQGIEAELLPSVFDRFVQSESSTTRRHGGLGLGLSIVKQLTVLHGGTVRADSAGPGRGARFTVALPLAPRTPRTRPERPAPERPPAPADVASLDILLVEDDGDSRKALGLLLARSGARVRTVASVREALVAYAARPPDVLVSDIGMPDEDGYALIRAIRAREESSGRRTLAIAMTGFASRLDHETALRAGFDAHVGKPFEAEALLERVRVLAAGRSSVDAGRPAG